MVPVCFTREGGRQIWEASDCIFTAWACCAVGPLLLLLGARPLPPLTGACRVASAPCLHRAACHFCLKMTILYFESTAPFPSSVVKQSGSIPLCPCALAPVLPSAHAWVVSLALGHLFTFCIFKSIITFSKRSPDVFVAPPLMCRAPPFLLLTWVLNVVETLNGILMKYAF